MVIEATAVLCMVVAIACGGLWVHAVARLCVSCRSLAALELNRAEVESAARAAGEEMARLRETLDAGHRSGRSSKSLRKIRLQAGRRFRARPVPGQKPNRVARRKCRNRIGLGLRNPGDLQAPHRPWGRSVLERRHRGTRATRARRHGERGPGLASAPRCNHQSPSCASRNSSPVAPVPAATIRFPAVGSAEKQILRIIIATYTTRR
jgi:hypothetical protein